MPKLHAKKQNKSPNATVVNAATHPARASRKQQEQNRRFIVRISEIISSSLDYHKTLQRVAEMMVPDMADWCAVDMLAEDGSDELVAVAHSNPAKIRWARKWREQVPIDMQAPTGIPQVYRTGKPEFYPVITKEMIDAQVTTDEERQALKELGTISAVIIVPLKIQKRVFGAITLVCSESGRYYTKEDLATVEELAHYASLAVDNAILYRKAMFEIDERTRAHKALKESEQRFKQLFELAPDVIYSISAEGILTSVNPAFERLTKWSAKQWVGQSFIGLVHPDDRAFALQKFQEGLTTKNQQPYQLRILAKDGSYRIGEFRTSPYEVNGKTVGKFGIARDVTERVKAEKELYRLAAIVSFSTDAIYSKTPEDIIVSWNKGAERLYGYRADEIIGKHVSILVPTDHMAELRAIEAQTLAGKVVKSFETVRIKKSGQSIIVSVSVSPIKDAKGKVIGGSSITEDVTERRHIQDELKRSKEQLEVIFKNVADGIIVFNSAGKLIFVNDKAAIMCGFPTALAMLKAGVGRALSQFSIFDEHDKPYAPHKLPSRLARVTKEPQQAVIGFCSKKGSEVRWTLEKSTPVLNDAGEVELIVSILQDITEQKLLENRKDDFISIASHELKTPITSMKAFTQIMQAKLQRSADHETITYLAKIDGQLNRLTKLVNDLLNVNKMQSGKLEFGFERFSLDAFLKEYVDDLQKIITTHKIIVSGNMHVFVYADRDRLGQVMINLVTNAAKYSPKADRLILTVSHNQKEVTLCVQDFGVGIPKQYQDRIFERFYRIAGQHGESYPGLGLGLYIAAEIIRRHHGKIWVESQVNKGSKFTFTIPIDRAVS